MWSPLAPVWSKPAAKQLRKLAAVAARIEAAVNRYAVTGLGDVTAMRSEPGSIRLKVGDYRVVFAISATTGEMLVARVGDRKDIYD